MSVIAALLLTHLFWWHMQPIIYPFFLTAVVISSWYSGFRAGTAATLLGAFLSEYFFCIPVTRSPGV
ncbi:MAG: DUF4118 domain-containing protein [Oculatellaceae cyanobacterium Prado106]|nr:DUF4118 domain-containing protein [Oculatellaceae cyanobacterium Prado106]